MALDPWVRPGWQALTVYFMPKVRDTTNAAGSTANGDRAALTPQRPAQPRMSAESCARGPNDGVSHTGARSGINLRAMLAAPLLAAASLVLSAACGSSDTGSPSS